MPAIKLLSLKTRGKKLNHLKGFHQLGNLPPCSLVKLLDSQDHGQNMGQHRVLYSTMFPTKIGF